MKELELDALNKNLLDTSVLNIKEHRLKYKEFNFSNFALALEEFLGLSNQLYKLINYNNIENKLLNKFNISQSNAKKLIKVSKKVLASKTLKSFYRSRVFQKLYDSENLRENFEIILFCNERNRFCSELIQLGNALLDKLMKSPEIVELLSPMEKFEKELSQIFDAIELKTFNSPAEKSEWCRSQLVNYKFVLKFDWEKNIKPIKRSSSDFIRFEFLGKKFQLKLQYFSHANLSQLYLKYNIFEKETVDDFIKKLFASGEVLLLQNINFNTTIFLIEFCLSSWLLSIQYSFYLKQRKNATLFYNTLVARDSRFADVTIDMMIDYINRYDNMHFMLFLIEFRRHEIFWSGFIDYLKKKELQEELNDHKKRMNQIMNTADTKIDKSPEYKAPKEKLLDDKYIFATRLHYKAEIENVSFPKLCREAAEKYVDMDGNELNGRNLEEAFKSMNHEHGLKNLRKRAGLLKYLL